MRPDLLTQLIDVLAALYGDAASARTMATTAGLPLAQIAFDAKASNTWAAILNEAEQQGRTLALLDGAQRVPQLRPLQAARQAYDRWVADGRPNGTPPAAPHHHPGAARPSTTREVLPSCAPACTQAPDQLAALDTLEDRFQRNQRSERIFGATPETKSEHAQVVYVLNELALQVCGVSFNEMGSRD
ncbi:MAG: hypothetical protein HZY76_07455 [Anaerolineae bacterium]|nr:MAG: hypothetical protein HZY76_07455 [Anaerolineae bacterium]